MRTLRCRALQPFEHGGEECNVDIERPRVRRTNRKPEVRFPRRGEVDQQPRRGDRCCSVGVTDAAPVQPRTSDRRVGHPSRGPWVWQPHFAVTSLDVGGGCKAPSRGQGRRAPAAP
ncbi:hypothetical protein EYF80_046404 [Liparis tanakae]|uniref:Uncharacterized protein n=1 Tax=Liparis tanakae TaxID=230148 RepID=A0A4Z2FRB0_9TELE|nr:hypothetical protein EYF80_046404 [Liparis tanakae]